MKKEAGNEYQGLSIDGIGITVVATQYTYENDSFGNEYDASAGTDEFKQGVTISGIAGNLIVQVKNSRVALDKGMANRIMIGGGEV